MAVIHHSLDLVLCFIDTTTGLGIYTPPIRVYKNGERLSFQRRDTGQVLLVGCGREDFELTVELSGFENITMEVQYDKLNKQMPLLQLHMIPLEGGSDTTQLITLKGKLAGITALDAIPAIGNHCLLEQFSPKQQQITVFSRYQLMLDNLHYAIRNDANASYQPFCVTQQVQPTVFAIDRPLVQLEGSSLPILPINMGQVKPDGSYLLRVRDEGQKVLWILRWQVGDQVFFKSVDFHEPDTMSL